MTKIYYGRDLIGRFTCDGKLYTPWQAFGHAFVKWTKLTLLVLGSISVIGWSIYLGGHISPRTVYATQEVIKEVKGVSPVMVRIATCESGNSHHDKKTGQVIMRANNNKTVDIGKYQINSVWHKKATELGLDITRESDNERMAYWIYENRGTEDWYASKDCWSK